MSTEREHECRTCGSDNAYRQGGQCNACMRRLVEPVTLTGGYPGENVECHDCGRTHPKEHMVQVSTLGARARYFCHACQPYVTLRMDDVVRGEHYFINVARFGRGGRRRMSEEYTCGREAVRNLDRDRIVWLREYVEGKHGATVR